MNIEKFGKGGLIQKNDLRNYRLEAIPTATVLPEKFEITYGGKIKHQNGSGSCVSQAVSYYLQVINFMETGEWTELSPRYLYSSVFINPMGSYVKDNMAMVCNSGIAEEADVPSYEYGLPPSEAYMRKKDDISESIKEEALTYWARNYLTWDNSNVDWYKKAILIGNGCVACSWGNNEVWKTGDIELPAFKEQLNWMHGVYFLGWDDKKQAFKFINSWGDKWGYGGYGWLPYKYITSGYVSNPMTMVDLPNQQYTIMMKIIGLLKNLISLLQPKK